MKNLTGDKAVQQLAAFKSRIEHADEALARRFWNGEDADQLIRKRASFIDGFLTELWEGWFETEDQTALFAIGGYGRGKLHPKSDIDLLVLIHRRMRQNPRVEQFVRLLWDLKLDIGHSVRTVDDCKKVAKDDLSVVTALMERRLLTGSSRLAQELDHALNNERLWPSKVYAKAKQEEQTQRHATWGDVEYGLEPDVKNSPGGLRDLQTIGWITKRHYRTDSFDELCDKGILTDQERNTAKAGRSFLWRVRFALHLLAGRRHDHLSFHYQRQIAERFGYEDSNGLLAVEHFMRDYYRHVLELREVNDILLQHFNEAILHGGRTSIRRINERFQLCNGYIETTHDDVFSQSPEAFMEIFVVLANHREIEGVRASTIRLMRANLHLINESFRKDPRVSRLFLELLRSPYTVASHLTRMRRYGILGKYIPAFGQVIGQMQHDLFHIYTVDAHTIMTIRHMRRFFMPLYRKDFPFVMEAIQHIAKVELLFLAGMFHDIGKGRGGDHSKIGAEQAKAFCRSLELKDEDVELVVWLVRHHLALSTTAQREDIDDPDVVVKFAELTETEQRLSYLVALTVADINATNPNLWNGWRASLIGKLYRATRDCLRAREAGRNTPLRQSEDVEKRALEELGRRGMDSGTAKRIWEDSNDALIIPRSLDRTIEITWAIHNHQYDDGALVLARDITGPAEGEEATEIFVSAPNRPLLFAVCVSLLDQMHLQVLNARIETGTSQMCYDSFIVLDLEGKHLTSDTHKRSVCKRLRSSLQEPTNYRKMQQRRIRRQLTQFARPATVTLTEPNREGKAKLELVASDRPGLLALVGEIFVELGIDVHEARIATLGERVEDVFVISASHGKASLEPYRMQTIVDTLTKRIDAAIEEVA
ncbi:MAG: [protein-PII] uridylyltransferase [Gammaproteobacteria bacterium]|nr:[protein-PII] uridylyltransferase [Gammaproteobacteria bacterium]